jgi:hypothetical protein
VGEREADDDRRGHRVRDDAALWAVRCEHQKCGPS